MTDLVAIFRFAFLSILEVSSMKTGMAEMGFTIASKPMNTVVANAM
jgi:hypothetical protein